MVAGLDVGQQEAVFAQAGVVLAALRIGAVGTGHGARDAGVEIGAGNAFRRCLGLGRSHEGHRGKGRHGQGEGEGKYALRYHGASPGQ